MTPMKSVGYLGQCYSKVQRLRKTQGALLWWNRCYLIPEWSPHLAKDSLPKPAKRIGGKLTSRSAGILIPEMATSDQGQAVTHMQHTYIC